MHILERHPLLLSSLIVAGLALSSRQGQCTPSSSRTGNLAKSHNFSYQLAPPAVCRPVLALAIEAVAAGDRVSLARMYKLSLLADQKFDDDQSRESLRCALSMVLAKTRELYLVGDLGEAIERLRLLFNLSARLTELGDRQSLNEGDTWLMGSKILTLPKKSCIGALNDYAYFLNLSGQSKIAIPVLQSLIQEEPSRAAAYWHLADAQSSSGDRQAAAASFRKYEELLRPHKTELSSRPLSKPLLKEINDLEALPASRPVAVLTATGKLLATTYSQIKLDRNSTPINTTIRQLDNCLPWLKPYDKDSDVTAITDGPPQSWHRHAERGHTIWQTDNQKCLDLNCEAILALQDEQPQDAIKVLNEALTIDPGNLYTLANMSVAFNNLAWQRRADCLSALNALHQAQAFAPASATVQANIKSIIRRMGKDPESAKVRLAFAHECIDRRDFLGALIECRAALKIHDEPEIKAMISAVTNRLIFEELPLSFPRLSQRTTVAPALTQPAAKQDCDWHGSMKRLN